MRIICIIIAIVVAGAAAHAQTWYSDALQEFVDKEYMDGSSPFIPSAQASRAELVGLLVNVRGGVYPSAITNPTFDDVRSQDPYVNFFEEAVQQGWLRGANECAGRTRPCFALPYAQLNRAEAATLIVRALDLTAAEGTPEFEDVDARAWYAQNVAVAASRCILQGDAGTQRVRPEGVLNRAEMIVMVHRAQQQLSFGTDCGTQQNSSSQSSQAFEASDDSHVTSNEDIPNRISISPQGNSPATSLWQSLITRLEQFSTLREPVGEQEEIAQEEVRSRNGLTIEQRPVNEFNDAIPKGSLGLHVLSLELSASCDESVAIESIGIVHRGHGPSNDLQGAWLRVDGLRRSRTTRFSSDDGIANLRFSPQLIVPACDSIIADVYVDFFDNALEQGRHIFALELPNDIRATTEDIAGAFPIDSSMFRIGNATTGLITIEYVPLSGKEVTILRREADLAQFSVSVDTTEDQTFEWIQMQNTGTSQDNDITRLFIERDDGTRLTEFASGTEGDRVTFLFEPPEVIEAGETFTFTVVGSIGGGTGTNVRLRFEEPSDVHAIGSVFGFGSFNAQRYGSRVRILGRPERVNIGGFFE